MNEHFSTQSPISTSVDPSINFQPLSETHLANPYPSYTGLRKEDPIFYSEQLDAWVVTKYDDILAILKNPDIFLSKDTLLSYTAYSDETIAVLRTGYPRIPITINSDGVPHSRYRAPLTAALSPVRVKEMEGFIQGIANRLVDAFLADGHTDLMKGFAAPLPLEVILTLFGVPIEDMTRCKRWSDDFHDLVSAPLSPERQVECARSFVAFQHYIADIVERNRQAPKDDLVGLHLTTHYKGEEALQTVELVNSLLGTLLAGHETTTYLIGNAVLNLLEQDQWQTLVAHPEYIADTVEEILRFDTSVQTFYRTTSQETTFGDVTFPEGTRLLLVYGSGNRDESQFPEPDHLDIHRSPNRHLAFGYGSHFCVGAPLARLEGRVAIEVLSKRLPHLRLTQGQSLPYLENLMFRGLTRLNVEWDV